MVIKDESQLRILLISSSVNESLELHTLLSDKFEVNVVNGPHLLLDKIRAIPPDIIIVAANFDLEWIPKLRTYPETHHLPIVQYRNSSHRTIREYALIDFDDYLDDAMSLQELFARISATVNGAHARAKMDVRERMLAALDDATRSLSDPEEITLVAATLLGMHLNTNRCAYADVESDQDTFNLTGNYNNGVPSIVGRYTFTQFGTECLRLMREGLPYIVEDSETDLRIQNVREAYRMTFIRSVICVPLMKNGRFVAAMAVHQKSPRLWRGDEVELLLLVANRCWESIERIRVARELSANEARYRILIETISAVVWHTSPEGKITTENPSWETFTGQSFSEYSDWGWCKAIHPDDIESVLQVWNNAVQGLKRYETRYRLRRYDGEYRFVVANATPIMINGHLREWIGNCVDVTEAKRVNDELRANDRRKDEFLAMLAHELRNPLAPIRHAAQLLELTNDNNSSIRQIAEIISRQTHHMASLVDDLLDVSRLNRGLVVVNKERIDFHQVIANAVEQIKPLIDFHHHELQINVEDANILVMGDFSRLVQVFSNLLHNAAKYTSQGGVIKLIARADGEEIVTEVIDNGIGISQELLPHIFDLFTQGNRLPDRSQGGLGLGLPLVKSLVLLHGGTIRAVSESDKGACFTVRLPLEVNNTSTATISTNPILILEEKPSLHIMVVDDNEDAAYLISLLLEAEGHQVFIENKAKNALERVKENMPQACILDIGIPEINGYELAKLIRAMPNGENTLLIALTGYGTDEDRQTSKQAGFDYHLVKPCEPKELMQLLIAGRPKSIVPIQ